MISIAIFIANTAAIFLGSGAALFWLLASRAEVAPTPEQDPHGKGTIIGRWIVTSVGNRRVNVGDTMVKQSKLNATAAAFACTASVSQIVAVLLGRIPTA